MNEYPNFKRNSQETRIIILGSDGRFTIPALPGRGLIAARAQEERYLHGKGAEAIKGFEHETAFATYPFYCFTATSTSWRRSTPRQAQRRVTLDLQVDPGRTVTGRVVGPDGPPVVGGVEIRTLDVFQAPAADAQELLHIRGHGVARGPVPNRLLPAWTQAGRLARLEGDEKGSLTVKLQPWGTVVGRVVDENGKPRTDVEIFSTIRERPNPERGDLRTSRRSTHRGGSGSKVWFPA